MDLGIVALLFTFIAGLFIGSVGAALAPTNYLFPYYGFLGLDCPVCGKRFKHYKRQRR
jgi:hypothetical protein